MVAVVILILVKVSELFHYSDRYIHDITSIIFFPPVLLSTGVFEKEKNKITLTDFNSLTIYTQHDANLRSCKNVIPLYWRISNDNQLYKCCLSIDYKGDILMIQLSLCKLSSLAGVLDPLREL